MSRRLAAERKPNNLPARPAGFLGTASEKLAYACADGAHQASSTPPQCAALGPHTRGGTIPAVLTHGRISRPRTRRVAHGGALLIAVLTPTVLMSLGCQKALFSPKDDRTQYDRYRRARSDVAPPYIEDEYGRRTPNLRERLTPGR